MMVRSYFAEMWVVATNAAIHTGGVEYHSYFTIIIAMTYACVYIYMSFAYVWHVRQYVLATYYKNWPNS